MISRLATSTRSTGLGIFPRFRRKPSRSNRFVRLRLTEGPTLRATARPSRLAASPFGTASRRNCGPSRRTPRLKTLRY